MRRSSTRRRASGVFGSAASTTSKVRHGAGGPRRTDTTPSAWRTARPTTALWSCRARTTTGALAG
ncbi:hypothetical protein [Nonomuraea sp. KM90]|uniref:hypothetical protein n=1 Tax=Nonomuraea sp. KM90 TaxID=3457428 RepID=UPI003FCC550B